MLKEIPKHHSVCVLGDPHSYLAYEEIVEDIRGRLPNSSPLVVLCVGDTGFGFHGKSAVYRLHQVNKALVKHNAWLFCVRGNHDRKEFFDGRDIDRIRLYPDYTSFAYKDRSFLMIGGAVSIDRNCNINIRDLPDDTLQKVKGNNLFDPDEGTSPCPPDLGKYDVVISHDCPQSLFQAYGSEFTPAFGAEWLKAEPELGKEIQANREILDQVREKANPSEWFFGHYHLPFSLRDSGTMFRCLEPLAIHSINYL